MPATRVGRDADAGIADGEPYEIAFRRDADADAAGVGELDGVPRQIVQHLPQPRGIAHQAQLDIGRDVAGDLDVLALRAGRQQLDGPLHERQQVERLVREFQPARFDAREIEDLLDDREQRLARGLDRADIGGLLEIDARPEQQVGHAEHAVERRPDFVAHGGEKARLGFVGRFGAKPRLGQFRLGLSPGRDVAADDLDFAPAARGMDRRLHP